MTMHFILAWVKSWWNRNTKSVHQNDLSLALFRRLCWLNNWPIFHRIIQHLPVCWFIFWSDKVQNRAIYKDIFPHIIEKLDTSNSFLLKKLHSILKLWLKVLYFLDGSCIREGLLLSLITFRWVLYLNF